MVRIVDELDKPADDLIRRKCLPLTHQKFRNELQRSVFEAVPLFCVEEQDVMNPENQLIFYE